MNTSSNYNPTPTVIGPLPVRAMTSHYTHFTPNSITSRSRVDIRPSRWSSPAGVTTPPLKFVHKYVDRSEDPLVVKKPKDSEVAQRGAARQFPTKLYEMLSKASSDESEGGGFEDCVSWQPHGRCFIVRDPKTFVATVMPNFFAQSKLTSFQRQLSLYGFARLTQGKDQGAYFHERFLRGRPDLIHDIVRTRVKGTGCKAPSSPETEPDFYAMKHCSLHPTIPVSTPTSTSQQMVSSNATAVSDVQTSVGGDQDSSKDDESTTMSDIVDEYFVGGSATTSRTGNSVEGVYTHGTPFNANMELFLPRGFQETAAARTQTEQSGPAGPLDLPGRLRNTVKQEYNGTTSVVKFIPMDLSQRMKSRDAQWDRWAAPLKNEISTTLLTDEEAGWNGSALAGQPLSMAGDNSGVQAEARSSAVFVSALPSDCGQVGGPTLEDIIYMI